MAAARARGLGKPPKSLVEPLQIIELLCKGVAEKNSRAVIDIAACQQGLQLGYVVGMIRLDAQLRAQEIARVVCRVQGDCATAGGFGFGEPAEAALARSQVVPESR